MNDKQKEEAATLNKLLREYTALSETQSIVEQKSYNMGQDYSDMGGLWNEEERALIDLQSLKNLFKDENWVYVVCDLVALKISSQPMEVCRRYKDSDGNV